MGWKTSREGIIPAALSPTMIDSIPFASSTASASRASRSRENVSITNRPSLSLTRASVRDGEGYFGVTFVVFCGEIIRCANGDPENMIHGPPATGASEIPVLLNVA